MMTIAGKRQGERVTPLEWVTVTGLTPGTVTVTDGAGHVYLETDGAGHVYLETEASEEVSFLAGGTLGVQTVSVTEADGSTQQIQFEMDAHTEIQDAGGQYQALLQALYATMISDHETGSILYHGRIYRYFVCWLRDHVHTLKGMKYFADYLKDGIDLYRNSQREDGMIWDNCYKRTAAPNYWDMRFHNGDFIRPFEDYTAEFKRIPVENDVEYLFVEGLYYTWKAVGDDGWMADSLDAAMRALEYSVTNAYRWSEQYKLLKRGHTIDTWDFQDEADSNVDGDAMRIEPGKTHFGVMFGDNTGYAAACHYLAEMLEYVGRTSEAETYREREQQIRSQLDAVSWNGEFFTHHVREEPDWQPDLGVDESRQVSLSNAYSLNRGITHEQCTAILRTYQKIKDTLPAGSPGEWYTIYPPFQKGYGGHNSLWEYMNGGVTPIVAGELAHGAFQHGFESYGADILSRMGALIQKHGQLHSVYTGAATIPPTPKFTPLDISELANTDFAGTGAPGVPGWTDEGENDLHEMPVGKQTLAGIEFLIPDPATNGRRGCIGLSNTGDYARQEDVLVEAYATSIHFLHAVSRTGSAGLGGFITLHYLDGTQFHQYVIRGQNVSGWWLPHLSPDNHPTSMIAWRGKNASCAEVGVTAYSLANPHPEKKIDHITLKATEEIAFWAVLGITISDQPPYFPPTGISHGIPDNWSAAAVTYALVEGLAGVVDDGVAYDRLDLSPRWTAAGVDSASVTVRYPASRGYAAYRFAHDAAEFQITLEVTASSRLGHLHILLPEGASRVMSVKSGDTDLPFEETLVEESRYADFVLDDLSPKTITISYA